MARSEKPRNRSGYSAEELEQAKAACLTIAVTLGAYLDDLCIVGGLVPALLIDATRPAGVDDDGWHPGTNDLDVGLALALLDDERYAEISSRLRAEGFGPDVNAAGNPTAQRWRLRDLKVTVDFLMPPVDGQMPRLRVQRLQSDFGALVTPGLELAFDERVEVELTGRTLNGERVRRSVPVCGPAAFTVLKALAFGQRGEPKDAFDLTYVLRHTSGRGGAVARRLDAHAESHRPAIARALELLARDFGAPDDLGPVRAAEFALVAPYAPEEAEEAAADAHGYVDELLSACAGLSWRSS